MKPATEQAREEPLLELWRGGEAALGRPRAVNRHAERLPRRLAWLLRALDAVHRGDRKEVGELHERLRKAGMDDMAWILQVVLMRSPERDPTQIRLLAKQEGADRHARLPFLDLLRALAVRAGGRRGARSQKLTQMKRGRPLLEIALELFHPPRRTRDRRDGTFDAVLPWNKAAETSSRIREIFTMAWAVQNRMGKVRQVVQDCVGRLRLDWSPEMWPDLNSKGRDSVLQEWLASDQTEWRKDLTRQIRGMHRRVGEERLGAAIHGLLRKVHDALQGERSYEALPIVLAAQELVERLPRAASLQGPLRILELQLAWVHPHRDMPLECLVSVWNVIQRRPIEEKRVVARLLVGHRCSAGSPTYRRQAVGFLIAAEPSAWERRDVVKNDSSVLEAKEFLAYLRHPVDVEPLGQEEQHYLRGWYETLTGNIDEAVECLRPLANSAQARWVRASLELLWAMVSLLDGFGERLPSGLVRLTSLYERPGFTLWQRVVVMKLCVGFRDRRKGGKPGRGKDSKPGAGLRSAILHDLDGERPEDTLPCAAELVALAVFDRAEDAEERFVEMGRFLHRSRKTRVRDVDCLRVVAQLSFLAGWGNLETRVKPWVKSLTAFLLRDGPETLRTLAEQFDHQDPMTQEGLLTWYSAHHEDTGDIGVWEEMLLGRLDPVMKVALGQEAHKAHGRHATSCSSCAAHLDDDLPF